MPALPLVSDPPSLIAVVGPPGSGKTTLIKSLIKVQTKVVIKPENINGPITVLLGKKTRLTYYDCPNDLSSMIDIAKSADLIVLVINAVHGFELETFEFLNILFNHGFPHVMGFISHLDTFKENKQLRNRRTSLKNRFLKEVNKNATVFFPRDKIQYSKYYSQKDMRRLGHLLSSKRTKPTLWRSNHPFLLCDRFQDVTDPKLIEENPLCDRTISLYGYSRGATIKPKTTFHLPGAGDFVPDSIVKLIDPCPLIMTDPYGERKLATNKIQIYAPFSNIGELETESNATYLDISLKHQKSKNNPESKQLISKLTDMDSFLDEKIGQTQIELFPGTAIEVDHPGNDYSPTSPQETSLTASSVTTSSLLGDFDIDELEESLFTLKKKSTNTDVFVEGFHRDDTPSINISDVELTELIENLSNTIFVKDRKRNGPFGEGEDGEEKAFEDLEDSDDDDDDDDDSSQINDIDVFSESTKKLSDEADGFGLSDDSDEDEDDSKSLTADENTEQSDDDDDEELSGYKPGSYLHIKISGMPPEFVLHFNPRYPILLGGLLSGEKRIVPMRIKIKRHRWFPKQLKSNDPLIISVGWRRYQTIPTFLFKDAGQDRYRFLKYTPEYLHCFAHIQGPQTPSNTGLIAFKSLDRTRSVLQKDTDSFGKFTGDKTSWRVAGTGVIVDSGVQTPIKKKLKLVGTAYKVNSNTAFIKDMFTSSLEVAKFTGARIMTVSGIKGEIKGSVSKPDGAFRGAFQDKILISDIVFCKTWTTVNPLNFYNPVTNLLDNKDILAAAQSGTIKWKKLRSVKDIRNSLLLASGKNPTPLFHGDSVYTEIERQTRKFNPLHVPRSIEQALPYKSKPKLNPKTKQNSTYIQKRKSLFEKDQEQKKIAATLQVLKTIRNQKEADQKAARVARKRQRDAEFEKGEEVRLRRAKKAKKWRFKVASKRGQLHST